MVSARIRLPAAWVDHRREAWSFPKVNFTLPAMNIERGNVGRSGGSLRRDGSADSAPRGLARCTRNRAGV